MGLCNNEAVVNLLYAFFTVVITVNCFVFYNIYVLNGEDLKKQADTKSVLDAIDKLGGSYMFGTFIPLWSVILIECSIAYALEVIFAGPMAFKLASKMFDPATTNQFVYSTAITCCTVNIMCPCMSFMASFFFYQYDIGFNVLTVIADWFKLMCYNYPFAFFVENFIVQPFMRQFFKVAFGFSPGGKGQKDEKEKEGEGEGEELNEIIEIKDNEVKENPIYDLETALNYIEQVKSEIIEIYGSSLTEESIETDQGTI